jgi:hypothetical protein
MLTGSPFLFARRQREGDEPRAIEQKVLGVEVYAHAGRSKAAAYARKRVCPVRDWAPHDLRRTARASRRTGLSIRGWRGHIGARAARHCRRLQPRGI